MSHYVTINARKRNIVSAYQIDHSEVGIKILGARKMEDKILEVVLVIPVVSIQEGARLIRGKICKVIRRLSLLITPNIFMFGSN